MWQADPHLCLHILCGVTATLERCGSHALALDIAWCAVIAGGGSSSCCTVFQSSRSRCLSAFRARGLCVWIAQSPHMKTVDASVASRSGDTHRHSWRLSEINSRSLIFGGARS